MSVDRLRRLRWEESKPNDFTKNLRSHELRVRLTPTGWDVLVSSYVFAASLSEDDAVRVAIALENAARIGMRGRRIDCPVCGRNVGVMPDDRTAYHNAAEPTPGRKSFRCPGAFKKPSVEVSP